MTKVLFLIAIAILIFLSGAFFIFKKITESKSVVAVRPTPSLPMPSPEATATPYPVPSEYKVPILMYHYIRTAPINDPLGVDLSVSPVNFDAQMKFLKDNGYQTLTVANLASPEKQALGKILAEGKKPVALTFDDGYADAYTSALPILKKYDFTGTFYIIRNDVGLPNYMNQAQIDELSRAGMEIGSHTLAHKNLQSLSFFSQQKEIFDSKQNAQTFCYPSGKYNQMALGLVRQAGYLAAVTTNEGLATENSDLFQLPRVRIKNFSIQTFREEIINPGTKK